MVIVQYPMLFSGSARNITTQETDSMLKNNNVNSLESSNALFYH